MSPSTLLAAVWVVSVRWLLVRFVAAEIGRVPVRAVAFVAISAACLKPLWGTELWVSLGALGVAAAVIDRALAGPRGHALRPFLNTALDLFLVPGLLLAWLLLAGPAAATPLSAWPASLRDPIVLKATTFLAALTLVTTGGTRLVRSLLDEIGKMPSPLDEASSRWDPKAGRLIGNLERILIFLLTIHGELEAVGYVLAAKSVARFKDLDEQGFAEYYLVGTLTSALVALAVGESLRQLWAHLDTILQVSA